MKIKFKDYGFVEMDYSKYYKFPITDIYKDIYSQSWVIDVPVKKSKIQCVARLPEHVEQIKVNLIEKILLRIFYKGVIC